MTPEIFWAIIGTLVTVIIAMVGGIMAVRNEVAKRADQRWQRALSYAQVLSASDTPPLVKEVAQLALYDVGIEIREFEERAAKPSMKHLDTVVDAFDVPPSREQARQLKEAITQLPNAEWAEAGVDPDLRALVAAGSFLKERVLGLEAAFARARASGRAEDDTRLRIVFVLILFAAAFLTILVAAMRSALAGYVLG